MHASFAVGMCHSLPMMTCVMRLVHAGSVISYAPCSETKTAAVNRQ